MSKCENTAFHKRLFVQIKDIWACLLLQGRHATANLNQARPNILPQFFFDQLFLMRAYWNPKSRQGPGLGGALPAVAALYCIWRLSMATVTCTRESLLQIANWCGVEYCCKILQSKVKTFFLILSLMWRNLTKTVHCVHLWSDFKFVHCLLSWNKTKVLQSVSHVGSSGTLVYRIDVQYKINVQVGKFLKKH